MVQDVGLSSKETLSDTRVHASHTMTGGRKYSQRTTNTCVSCVSLRAVLIYGFCRIVLILARVTSFDSRFALDRSRQDSFQLQRQKEVRNGGK